MDFYKQKLKPLPAGNLAQRLLSEIDEEQIYAYIEVRSSTIARRKGLLSPASIDRESAVPCSIAMMDREWQAADEASCYIRCVICSGLVSVRLEQTCHGQPPDGTLNGHGLPKICVPIRRDSGASL